MKRPVYDPDLHLFIDDSEISARHKLVRLVQTFRKETLDPVMVCDRAWEGTAIGTFTVLYDKGEDIYKMWYLLVQDRSIGYAVSKDGIEWTKPDFYFFRTSEGTPTNIVYKREQGAVFHVDHAPEMQGGWPGNSKYVACEYRGHDHPVPKKEPERGICAAWSEDGLRWVQHSEPVLPFQGDRTTVYFDDQACKLLLMTRHKNLSMESRQGVPGLKRDIGLWESTDLLNWDYKGAVLRPDDMDPPHTEFYGMTIFRYGRGFVGFILMYHKAIEKLDMQLAWSPDGYQWNRVGRREPCLMLGGEGSWDSHWVQASHNPPQIEGDRMKIWYNGGCTKHGSGNAHIKSVGTASLRLDGFVSMDAGREDGSLVTMELPCEQPKKLEVNASFPTGRLSVEVLDETGAPIDGYSSEDCRVDGTDGIRLAVRWEDRESVFIKTHRQVKLRFNLYQGSLFSYRWSAAT